MRSHYRQTRRGGRRGGTPCGRAEKQGGATPQKVKTPATLLPQKPVPPPFPPGPPPCRVPLFGVPVRELSRFSSREIPDSARLLVSISISGCISGSIGGSIGSTGGHIAAASQTPARGITLHPLKPLRPLEKNSKRQNNTSPTVISSPANLLSTMQAWLPASPCHTTPDFPTNGATRVAGKRKRWACPSPP